MRTDKLKKRAESAFDDFRKGQMKTPTPEMLSENFDKEVQRLRVKVRASWRGVCLMFRVLMLSCLGIREIGEDIDGVAECEGRQDAREDIFLLWRQLAAVHRATLRMCTRVRFNLIRLFRVSKATKLAIDTCTYLTPSNCST